jgi:hypothetical protein
MITRICCAHAGGQGKTTFAQALHVANANMGVPTKLAAADFMDSTGSSKLGQMYPKQVTELGIGPNVGFAKQANDLNAAVKYWDRLGPELIRGNTVIDLGANVVEQVIQWGSIRNLGQLLRARSAPPIDVFLVCKAEQRAIDDMRDLVERFGSSQYIPVRKIFVVLNEQGGGFEALDIRGELSKVKIDAELAFITMPRCSSELWNTMEQKYVSLASALSMTPDEVVSKLGIDFWAVYSGLEQLNDWFNDLNAEMKQKGVFL